MNASATFWRVWTTRGGRIDRDSELRTLDPAIALRAFRASLKAAEDADAFSGPVQIVRLSRCVSLSDSGAIVLESNGNRKAYRGRILSEDPRLFLPVSARVGTLIANTWPHWPSFVVGMQRIIEDSPQDTSREHVEHLSRAGILPSGAAEQLEALA